MCTTGKIESGYGVVLGNSTSGGSLGSMQNKGRDAHASQNDSEEFKPLKWLIS